MNNSKRHGMYVLGVLCLLIMVSGCKKKVTTPPPPPPKAPTATLSANPTQIEPGQSASLQWSTENATDVALDGNKVDPSGSQTVSPTQTTTYHLTAKGAGGTQEATAQITVVPRPTPTPTPTPTPAPTVTDEQLFAQNLTDVYFDYDKADLRPDGAAMLARAAQLVKQKGWKVQIEGNADERGSTEYNLALGERRADAAKQALLSAGVSADSLKTISYGKEKPQCTESNEDCWQKNRRDHFTLLH